MENLIRELAKEKILPPVIQSYFDSIRRFGNITTHGNSDQISHNELKIKKLIPPKDARRELRFLKYKNRYIGRNGFIHKEQYDYYIDTA